MERILNIFPESFGRKIVKYNYISKILISNLYEIKNNRTLFMQ